MNHSCENQSPKCVGGEPTIPHDCAINVAPTIITGPHNQVDHLINCVFQR